MKSIEKRIANIEKRVDVKSDEEWMIYDPVKAYVNCQILLGKVQGKDIKEDEIFIPDHVRNEPKRKIAYEKGTGSRISSWLKEGEEKVRS